MVHFGTAGTIGDRGTGANVILCIAVQNLLPILLKKEKQFHYGNYSK